MAGLAPSSVSISPFPSGAVSFATAEASYRPGLSGLYRYSSETFPRAPGDGGSLVGHDEGVDRLARTVLNHEGEKYGCVLHHRIVSRLVHQDGPHHKHFAGFHSPWRRRSCPKPFSSNGAQQRRTAGGPSSLPEFGFGCPGSAGAARTGEGYAVRGFTYACREQERRRDKAG